MQLQELLNPRVSYQVLITFDLKGAESSKYSIIHEKLKEALDFEKFIYLSDDDGKEVKSLPHNTFAVLWKKDETEQKTRQYFEEILLSIFSENNLHGSYVILVAQNWAVSAGEF